MRLSLSEPKYLKDSISIISELVNEARFKVTADAIELVAMDPANVAMVIFKLFSSSFVEYNTEGVTEFALNLNHFKQILKRSSPTDVIVLEIEENKLKVVIKSKSIRTFSLPIIELDQKDQKVPELTFPVDIATPSTELIKAIEDVEFIADSVSFVAEKEKFTVKAEGDLSDAKVEIPESEETKIKADSEEPVRAKYSVEYLKKMIIASKLAPEAHIKFNQNYPLRLEYNTTDKVSIGFILAPRVDTD